MFSFLLEMFVFGVPPDVFAIIGAILITLAVALISMRNYVAGLPENDAKRNTFKLLTY